MRLSIGVCPETGGLVIVLLSPVGFGDESQLVKTVEAASNTCPSSSSARVGLIIQESLTRWLTGPEIYRILRRRRTLTASTPWGHRPVPILLSTLLQLHEWVTRHAHFPTQPSRAHYPCHPVTPCHSPSSDLLPQDVPVQHKPFSDVNDTEKSAFAKGTSSSQPGFIGTITKGLVDTSKNAIKAVQVNKARHAVSFVVVFRGFDLDLTYITENIIAMGFPAGYLANECVLNLNQCYRNQMEEVIDFLETRHKGKYKAYNLCSERLYDVSLFEGKEDIENVVAVHCKAGMARTGLMICSLFLYLKFFPTAEEYMDFYNQKRCVDGNGLVLPSQILVHGSKAEARENSAGSGVNASSSESSEFKVMAADASVFSFGDEDDYESD
ncbi:hypothetical protein Bca52824_041089 [Brassica carinata]|uniref:Tyrosine specific protein phosphatases domain-containing protein n=1 Tax=Brassica carinata TaxID=52824 RepID=A0A8X7UW42_BRACI|nr:hypothetical protein Bca52824_041089 [Brassica carinata]